MSRRFEDVLKGAEGGSPGESHADMRRIDNFNLSGSRPAAPRPGLPSAPATPPPAPEESNNVFLEEQAKTQPIRATSSAKNTAPARPDPPAPRKDPRPQTPVREAEEGQDDYDYVKYLKKSMKQLFGFYIGFGNRITSTKMNLSQFTKMANDAGIAGGALDSKAIELTFISINKLQGNLEFEGFVKVLHQLAQLKYGPSDPNECFKRLLEGNIIPLYKVIYKETDLGVEDKIIKSNIGMGTLMLITIRKEVFLRIYNFYFPEEKTRAVGAEKALFQKSKQHLYSFLRDFELLPVLLNISIVNNFYNEVTSLDYADAELQSVGHLRAILGVDVGSTFSFFKFVFFLIKISLYVFSDPNNVPKRFRGVKFNSDEKFYMLLERMEVSQGFFNLGGARSTGPRATHGLGQRLALLPKEIADMHSECSAFPNFEEFLDKYDTSKKSWMLMNFDGEDREPKKAALAQKFIAKKPKAEGGKYVPDPPSPEFLRLIAPFHQDLEKIFGQYTTSGSVSKGQPKMNPFKFMKFLSDIKVVRMDNPVVKEAPPADQGDSAFILRKEADLIYTTLVTEPARESEARRTHVRSASRTASAALPPPEKNAGLSFSRFLKALEIIIPKLFPKVTLDKAVDLFHYTKIGRNLLARGDDPDARGEAKSPLAKEKISLSNKYVNALAQILKDEQLVGFLEIVHASVYPLYACYSPDGELLTFDGFHEFYKDFGIFPELVTNLKLEGIFEALSFVFRKNPSGRVKLKEGVEYIDQHLFIEGLVIVASEIQMSGVAQQSIFHKIAFLLGVMNESDGFSRLQKKSRGIPKYDITAKIRQRFPAYFTD